MSRVTISDVAMAAGVSKTAVSFAFNNPEKLGHATVERVLQVADGLGYAPHPAAREGYPGAPARLTPPKRVLSVGPLPISTQSEPKGWPRVALRAADP